MRVIFSLILVGLIAGTASADFVGMGSGFVIPDNDPGGISSTINVNLGVNEIASEVSVVLEDFDHTWVGDLIVTLSGPNGSIDLMYRTGQLGGSGFGSSSDVNGFYAFTDTGADWWNAASLFDPITQGVYAPSTQDNGFQSFKNTYDGTLINGDWTLTISDNAGGDTGSLGAWSLSIRSNPIPEPATLGLLGLATLGMVIRRRRA